MECRTLNVIDAENFRSLWLQGLHDHPDAFGPDISEAQKRTDEQWAKSLEDGQTYGCYVHKRLVGVVAISISKMIKKRHVVGVGPVYVHPDFRRQKVAQRLLQFVIEALPVYAEQVKLAVNADNIPAKRLYESLGFKLWGVEERAMKLRDGRYIDALWMVKRLNKDSGARA